MAENVDKTGVIHIQRGLQCTIRQVPFLLKKQGFFGTIIEVVHISTSLIIITTILCRRARATNP